MPPYVVVFETHRSSDPTWATVGLGVLFIGVGVLLVLCRQQIPKPFKYVFPYAWLGFAALWTLIVFASAVTRPNLVTALSEGRCEVTEGIVSDFHPMPYAGHENEWFVVNGNRFEYSDFEVTTAFNNTASHGGPMQKGLQVRIHHLGNDIAKLEIAR